MTSIWALLLLLPVPAAGWSAAGSFMPAELKVALWSAGGGRDMDAGQLQSPVKKSTHRQGSFQCLQFFGILGVIF
jgi:hypothetical protein